MDGNPQQRLVSKTQKNIEQFSTNDHLVDKKQDQTNKTPVSKKPVLKTVKIPQNLQQIADKVQKPREEPKIHPDELKTTRLKPTHELADEYKSGAVEGVENKWRDVSLKGIKPGPMVRLHPIYQDKLKTQQENAQPLQVSLSEKNLADERKIQSRGGARQQDLKQPVSEKIGRLMRSQVQQKQVNIKINSSDIRQELVEGEYLEAICKAPQVDLSQSLNLLSQYQHQMQQIKGVQDKETEYKQLEQDMLVQRELLLQDNNDGLLPLELFDNKEYYEMHTVNEWFSCHGRQFTFPNGDVVFGIPAYSRYLNEKKLTLEHCVVLSFNQVSNTFLIRWIVNGVSCQQIDQQVCTNVICRRNVELSKVETSNTSVIYDNCVIDNINSIKYVKRLNLLMRDEKESMWFQRREVARVTRRVIEQEANMYQFLQENMKFAAQLREHTANREIKIDFQVTKFLEFLADVAGLTSEIIDNIFHARVLYNPDFKNDFINKLSQQQNDRLYSRSAELVVDVARNFVFANMTAVLDYLRRSPEFESKINKINVTMPQFSVRREKIDRILQRHIATVSGEFQPDPIIALNSYVARQNRVQTLLFQGMCQYRQAALICDACVQNIHVTGGFYLFNFASLAPFAVPDQIKFIVKQLFGGGPTEDVQSYLVNIGLEKKEEVKKEDEDQNDNMIIKEAHHQVAEPITQMKACIAYYAHPSNKQISEPGYVSPELPLPIKQFEAIHNDHIVKVIMHFNDNIRTMLGDEVHQKLKEARLDITENNQIFEQRCQMLEEQQDFFSITTTDIEPSANCLDRPRPRNLYDLKRFCKLQNLKYFDVIMRLVQKTLNKYYNILLMFKFNNNRSYTNVCFSVNQIIKISKIKTLSEQQVLQLFKNAQDPLFYMIPQSVVDKSLLALFIKLDPYIRKVKNSEDPNFNQFFVDTQEQQKDLVFDSQFNEEQRFNNFVDPNCLKALEQSPMFHEYVDSKSMKKFNISLTNETKQISSHNSNEEYIKQLNQQHIICSVPMCLQLATSFTPSIKECNSVLTKSYNDILNITANIQTIENTLPCLKETDNQLFTLPAPSQEHDPWMNQQKDQFDDYLKMSEQGPICLLQIINYIVRQLFYINPIDHKDEQDMIRVLPYLDDFKTLRAIYADINNDEDTTCLTEYKNWDYEYVSAKQQENSKDVQQSDKANQPEKDSDNDDNDTESHEDVVAENSQLSATSQQSIKVNNSKFSLRDLRSFMIKLTVIKELLNNITTITHFGLYVISSHHAIDILQKRVALLRGIVSKILQNRTYKLAQKIITDWKYINTQLQKNATTAQDYATSKRFNGNFAAIRKQQQQQEMVLDRYMSVLEEFQLSYESQFMRSLQASENELVLGTYLYSEFKEGNPDSQKAANQVTNYIYQQAAEYKDKFTDIEVLQTCWDAKSQAKSIMADKDARFRQLEQQKHEIIRKDITKRREDLNSAVSQFGVSEENFRVNAKRDANTNQHISEMIRMQNKKKEIEQEMQRFKEDEQALELEITEFRDFETFVQQFTIFEQLWTIIAEQYSKHAGWTEQSFTMIDYKELEIKLSDWTAKLNQQIKSFMKFKNQVSEDNPTGFPRCCLNAANMAQDLIEEINQFSELKPLIKALRNPGLEIQHWQQIASYTVSKKIDQNTISLNQLVEEGLNQVEVLEQIERISNDATRESALIKTYQKIFEEGQNIKLEFKLHDTQQVTLQVAGSDTEVRYKNQNYYIIRSFDEVTQLIDEQFSTIQGIRSSPYLKNVKSLKSKIDDYENKLDALQQILDNWLKFQRLWLYLYPIFKSEDIKNSAKLREKAREFADVCTAWSVLSTEANKMKDFLKQLTDYRLAADQQLNLNLAESINRRFEVMETVNKELSAYLNDKRMSFSRFFFLADEELIQILSQTKDVTKVQDHIQKCFEGIKKLQFLDENQEKFITHMISPEGETIQLLKRVETKEDVDKWLNQIEIQMKLTVKQNLLDCWKDYQQNVANAPPQDQTQDLYETLMGPREQWLAKGPAQIVNVLTQTMWTYETQNAIANDTINEYYNELNMRIDRLVLWVGCTPVIVKQHPQIKYDTQIRKMLTTLLTLWVHNRDIVHKLIKKEEDPEFLFSSQLKYYFDEQNKRLYVKQVDAILDYQYEYLGNHDRLVITPLTDKCFLTLTSALSKFFGGNPLGPAGTGKSESVKDLAKSLAIGCYIFNCSEGLNEQSISKFFAGLCICGMYSCLDEFNRCRLDVLSVVAQQILNIQRSIRANKKEFLFEGNNIKLMSCAGIFITMNPGYAGRAELPTNLKNLFRPIAMTVPDYTMIAEILLFACGYRQASQLAVKIVMTLKLSSEQLSKASHYDFGMRALKSILNAASRLKRLYWDQPEDVLCLRALCDVNVAKFLSQDLPLFNNIISDLFMECFDQYNKQANDIPDDIYTMDLNDITADFDADNLVRRFIRDAALSLNLNPTLIFIEKTLQIYSTLSVRHGLMNVGLTMTGKSSALQSLQMALTNIRTFLNTKPDLCKEKFTFDAYPLFYPVQVFKINAKSITADELYGNFSADTNEWSDGIICTAMREAVRDESKPELKWIVLDSPVDALWIENLNTILDDSKRLCLTSNEVIQMTNWTAYMFEVRDLEVASPATVSRCGMIYFDHKVVNITDMFKSLCQNMIPSWFLELNTNCQQCWPVIKFCDESHDINKFDDLTVEGKTQTDAKLQTQVYSNETFTVLERLCILFEWLFQPIYKYIFENNNPVIFQKEPTVVHTLVKLLASYIQQYINPDGTETITVDQGDEMKHQLPPMAEKGGFVDSLFTFAMTWSVGAVGDQKIRSQFTQAFRHFAYDLPTYLIYQANQSNADMNSAKYKFSTSTVKVNQQQIDSIKQRAQEFQKLYKKNFPYGKYIFRLERQVQFQDNQLKKQRDQISCFHDVCIQECAAKHVKESLNGQKKQLTAMVIAENKDTEWMVWNNSSYTIQNKEFVDFNKFNDTIIPTPDVISLLAIIKQLTLSHYPILLAGPSGSGKTSLAKKLVEQLGQTWVNVKCVLTAQTTSTQLRSVVDTRLERKRKGIYTLNKTKKGLFYVDDSHMPAKEQYGAQPPLEVLRQLFEDKGWYDIKQGIFKKIIDMTTIIGCTSSANLMVLPERLVHHMTLVSIPENSDEAFKQIFKELLNPFGKYCGAPGISLMDNVVLATISLYRELCIKFKPTPAHMHYVFGPRDLSKVFQGFMLPLRNSNLTEPKLREQLSSNQTVAGLWVHECQRVFGDRLINLEDQQIFSQLLSQCWSTTEVSQIPLERCMPDQIVTPDKTFDISYGSALGDDICKYQQINLNSEPVAQQIEKYYADSLTTLCKRVLSYDMKLILFRYAVNHLIRLTRILQTERGHGLMIGMPSSGKRSLTRLAYLSLSQFYAQGDPVVSGNGYTLSTNGSIQVFEPNSKSDFLDYIRKAVIHCGRDSNSGLLIVQESLTDNFCLECINFLISLGEIPNLFDPRNQQHADDLKEIQKSIGEDQLGAVNKVRGKDNLPPIDTGKQSCLDIMAERVQRNLHIIIVVTPCSVSLDRIVSQFPSLLGSLTINWFTQWQLDTLKSIAKYYLKQDPSCDKIVDVLVQMHLDSENVVNKKYKNLCTSPATFLSMIEIFKKLKSQQLQSLDKKQSDYKQGVNKMAETNKKIEEIQQTLRQLQPKLEEQSRKVKYSQEQIEKSKKEAQIQSDEAEKKSKIADEINQKAQVLFEKCQTELDKARPIQLQAERALNALKNEDVQVMKKMANPPQAVKTVMESVCIILGSKFNPTVDNWNQVKVKFSDSRILTTLKEIKELTDASVVDKLYTYYVSKKDDEYNPQKIANASVAAAGLATWAIALYEYYKVMLEIRPMERDRDEAKGRAETASASLRKTQLELQKIKEKLEELEKEGEKLQQEMKILTDEKNKCMDDLSRAKQLESGLKQESERWKQSLEEVLKEIDKLTPTTLLATALCAQLGCFEFVDRNELFNKWKDYIINVFDDRFNPPYEENQKLTKEQHNQLIKEEIEKFKNFKIERFLFDVPTVLDWQSKDLGKDNFNVTSACVAMSSYKVPLLFDPQDQGRKWAETCLAKHSFIGDDAKNVIVKAYRYSDQSLTKYIKDALISGYSLVVESISSDEFVKNDPRIKAAIIAHNKLHVENQQTARVTYSDGKDIEVQPSFRLTLITTFDVAVPPDQYNDFRIVTFKTTQEALQDILVNKSYAIDDPQGNTARLVRMRKTAEDQTELLTNEKRLLAQLVKTVNPIEDNNLINLVKELSQKSNEIKRAMAQDAIKEKETEEKRAKYLLMAKHCASLFFVLLRLVNLDNMYQNSLQNFTKIFDLTVEKNGFEEGADPFAPERLKKITQEFAERLYITVSQGLFVNHKLSFSLDMAFTLELSRENISRKQFEIIMQCCAKNLVSDNVQIPENQYTDIKITDYQWRNFYLLCNTGDFMNLSVNSMQNYKKLVESDSVTDCSPVSELEFLLLSMLLKDSNIGQAAILYINKVAGAKFTNTEAPQLIDVCKNSINTIPTLILLSVDSDPSNQLVQLADAPGFVQQNIQQKCRFVSLGRGQGDNAKAAIDASVKEGGWVILGNTHLAGAWLQTLESIVESIGANAYDPAGGSKCEQISEHFRQFLTTMPFDGFPSSIIRTATKMSAEAPMGVKNNFIRMLQQLTNDDVNLVNVDKMSKLSAEQHQVATVVQQTFRKYLWNLGVYFSCILERRRFGPIGFSTSYDWADPDYIISKMQIHTMFSELLDHPANVIDKKINNCISALRFLISEINVGGRVSDHKDQLIVNSMMEAYYQNDLLKLGKNIQQNYSIPQQIQNSGTVDEYIQYVKDTWNEADAPELYGLDQISIIISKSQKGKQLLQTILLVNTSSGDSLQESNIDQEQNQLQKMLDELAEPFNLVDINDRYPTDYNECMNTVLTQECTRYNKLHQIIVSSITSTQKALKGMILKTQQTDEVRQCLKMNVVPSFWAAAAWPSIMALSNWLVDLQQRQKFINKWQQEKKLDTVWFSGFFYPQAFLTGTLQNYARRFKVAIDKLVLDFQISSGLPKHTENEQVLTGLNLQNAAFNEKLQLVDAAEQFTEVKYVKLIPVLKQDLDDAERIRQRYKCPVYRTSVRKGVLTTTGHSSNYIFDILVECEGFEDLNQQARQELVQKWVRRAAAIFQQKE